MFVYMGLMLDRSGVADIMMRNFVKVFGGIRGGLGLTVVVIGVLLATSTGIVGASVVLLAMLSMPIMLPVHDLLLDEAVLIIEDPWRTGEGVGKPSAPHRCLDACR